MLASAGVCKDLLLFPESSGILFKLSSPALDMHREP